MADTTKVTASKPKVGGAVFRAVAGTTLPTDATTALANTFKSLGYCSEDGVINAPTIDNEQVRAWGGDVVLDMQTGKTDEFRFTLLEALNDEVLKAVYGSANVTGTLSAGLTIKANSAEQEVAVWVIEMLMKGNAVKRVVIPHGKITAIEEITYSGSTAVGYGVTISATPDTTGNTHYEYIKG